MHGCPMEKNNKLLQLNNGLTNFDKFCMVMHNFPVYQKFENLCMQDGCHFENWKIVISTKPNA